MKEKIISRLLDYLVVKDIPPTRFEKNIGLSNGYLNTQKKRNADLGESVIKKIIDYCLDMNIEWLIVGRGEMLKSQQGSHNEIQNVSNSGSSGINTTYGNNANVTINTCEEDNNKRLQMLIETNARLSKELDKSQQQKDELIKIINHLVTK